MVDIVLYIEFGASMKRANTMPVFQRLQARVHDSHVSVDK